jgi:N-acetylglucosamine PTS system EIICBA or EIICB component
LKASVALQHQLQSLGRALMLPIAVLPVAGLMLRLGQPDLLGLPFVSAAGQAVFAFLGLLFAIGVAVGLAKDNNGAAALAGAVAYVVLTEGAKVLLDAPSHVTSSMQIDQATKDALVSVWKDKELAKLSVPAGIICGLAAGSLYNRFHEIRFPEYLSFFGGRRFVPIIAGLFGLAAAAVFGLGFPLLESGVDRLSTWVAQSGSFGLFAYGVLNRVLIITGLHHILNNVAWFVIGDYQGVTGDLNRFFAGDPAAGAFMTGYFPVMMFGLPAACFAMWRAAHPDRRKAVGGLFLSMALTSFLTGVTEPIEFTFMFLAPVLYAVHAVLTGFSMVLMDLLGSKIGFGFSAGLFDYILNFRLATHPLLLIPVGLAYAGIYYSVFSFVIRRFNLLTPGREIDLSNDDEAPAKSNLGEIAYAYIGALGGHRNITEINACMTRLRLSINDRALVCAESLKALGAKGVIEIGDRGLQVIIGPQADTIAGAMRSANIADTQAADQVQPLATLAPEGLCPSLIEIFGGYQNIEWSARKAGRSVIRIRELTHVDQSRLSELLDQRGFESQNGNFHILDKN